MAVVGVYTTWAQTKKISNADLLRGSGNCFGFEEMVVNIFVVDLKGWAVTGQEVALMEAQAYAYLDAPAASLASRDRSGVHPVPAYRQVGYTRPVANDFGLQPGVRLLVRFLMAGPGFVGGHGVAMACRVQQN